MPLTWRAFVSPNRTRCRELLAVILTTSHMQTDKNTYALMGLTSFSAWFSYDIYTDTDTDIGLLFLILHMRQ